MSELANSLTSTEKSSKPVEQTDFSPFNIPMIDRDFEETETEEAEQEIDFNPPQTESTEDYEEVPEFEIEEETETEQEQPIYNAELAQLSSNTILLVLENLLPKLAFYFTEIDTNELVSIDVADGTIERLEEINSNNQTALEDTIKKNLKPIAAPLQAVMKKRNLNVSPESMLMLTLAMVLGNITFDVLKMRKQNDKIIAQIIALNTKSNKKEKNKTDTTDEQIQSKAKTKEENTKVEI